MICAPKIRVNTVSPGLILTEWGLKFGEEKIEAARQATKLKRVATVEVSTTQWSALERGAIHDADLIETGLRGGSAIACHDSINDGTEPAC